MKKILLFAVVCLSGCRSIVLFEPEAKFYDKPTATPSEALEWAKTAPLEDLCQGTKNWRHEQIQKASLNEIKSRDIDTRRCYHTGMQLTP